MYYAMQNALLRRIFPAMCKKEKIPCTIQNLSVRNQSFMSLLNELMADDQNWLMTRIYFTIDEKTI